MPRRSKHWRTNIVAAFAITLFIAASLAVVAGLATFTEASAFLSTVAMPLMYLGFRFSADGKSTENNPPTP